MRETFRPVTLALFGALLLLATLSSANAADFRLADAAQHQDWDSVRLLLTKHVDVNARQPDGASALAWVAHWDRGDVADLLIQAGADANAANDLGVTPLALACENASAQMVRRLLEAGAQPALASTTGEVPLTIAARTGNVDAVKALLAHGAPVNAVDPASKQTPLMWAISEQHPAVTRALLDAGADINARSARGFTPLLFAARNGDAESAKALLDAGADPNAVWIIPSATVAPGGRGDPSRPDGSTPLMVAVASGRSEVAVLLLQRGANPNADTTTGYTALHAAVAKNLLGVVQALLANGANPNSRLTAAAPSNIFGRGAGAGAEVRPRKQEAAGAPGGGREASPFAARPTLPGATPFWLAAKYEDVPMMKALLDGGADPLLTTADGTTPLMVAAGLVQDQGPRRHRGDLIGGGFYSDWGENDSLDAVKFLLAHGADVNAVNLSNQTALHGAAYMGGDSVVRLLVASGARLDVQDAQGQTPFRVAEGHLNVAAQGLSSWPQTMALLRELGANPALGIDGRTMLRQYVNSRPGSP